MRFVVQKKKAGLGRLKRNEGLKIDEDELDFIAESNREVYIYHILFNKYMFSIKFMKTM